MDSRRAVSSLLVAALIAASVPARAQTADEKAQAEVLFEEGKRLMAEAKYDAACAKLTESNKLDSGVGTLLFLGECYRLAGRRASAWATFREAESVAGKTGDRRITIAQGRVQELEPRLSRMTVSVPAAVDGLVVTRDGIPLAGGLWGVAVPVDPGSHVVRATAPKHQPWEVTTSVGDDGASAAVTVPKLVRLLDAPPPPPGPREPTPARDEPSAGGTQRAIGLGLAGVGAVGVGLGTFFGIKAMGQVDDAAPHCGEVGCDPTGFDLRTDARKNANVATVAFVVGGALLVGGAVLYLVAPRKRAASGLAPPSPVVRF